MCAWIATRTGVQLPSPPAFARHVVESQGCRAVALAKADIQCAWNAFVASCGSASHSKKMPRFAYVYIFQSERNPEHFYTGRKNDLRDRLIRHNDGKVPRTAKWRPWRIKTYIALSDSERAAKLERYLKSASGRAFLKKSAFKLRSQRG